MNSEKEKRVQRKPVQSRGIETADKIIAAGKRCFEKHGYHGCNSKDIAQEADVGIGTLYGYFKNKKEIFIKVIDLFYDEIAEKTLVINQQDIEILSDPKKLVSLLLIRSLEAHTIAPDLHREMTAMYYSDPEIHEIIYSKDEEMLVMLELLLTTVKDKIKVSDLKAAAFIIYRSAEDIIHSLKMFDTPIDQTCILDETKEMIYKYLFT